MLAKAKVLYQVKLILDYLPEEEYKLIPKEIIDYIENNFEYDENILVDPSIPLERQNIDEKAYEILEKIIKKIEESRNKDYTSDISKYVEEVKESNNNYTTQIENIRLKKIIEILKKENSKIPKAKELIKEYKEVLSKKQKEIDKLKEYNEYLDSIIQKLPKLIRKKYIEK